MRVFFLVITAVLCCGFFVGPAAQSQLGDDIRDAMRGESNTKVVKVVDTVTCTDFEIIINRNCEKDGVQFIVLSKGKYAPYHPFMVGDTLNLTLLGHDVPRLPTVIPHITISRGQTVRTIPLHVIFGDTAWVEVAYSSDSVHVDVIDTIANVSIHEAKYLSSAVLPPVLIPKNMGTTDVQRYINKKKGELEKIGSIICLPAGYYQCFSEPLAVVRLGRRDSVNELAGQKMFFFQLTDTSAAALSMAKHILGGSE